MFGINPRPNRQDFENLLARMSAALLPRFVGTSLGHRSTTSNTNDDEARAFFYEDALF
jgi:hypothetical protein